NNPHNPMYGIATAGAQGLLLTLIGTESSVSGGNSQAPMALINPALQPTTISQPSDSTSLVPMPPGGGAPDPLAVAVLESQVRISGANAAQVGAGDTAASTGTLSMPNGPTPAAHPYGSDPNADAPLKNQVRCAYDKAAPMVGAVLEYAQRLKAPVMIYVFSDGSLTSTGMVDSSVGGRGKLGWQGDNASVASTFFLAYSPTGRPPLRNGAAGQQIGYFSSDGSVVRTSSPA